MRQARPSAASIRRELKALASPERATVSQRFFKTGPGEYGAGDRFLGIAVPVLRQLARQNSGLPLSEVLSLLRSRWHEERLLALFIMTRQYAHGTTEQRKTIYREYLRHTAYINNWDLVDSSAEHIVGAHVADGDRSVLMRLARSNDLWERRIAMLATFWFIKRHEFDEALRIARVLVDDSHGLIQKAVGWMLREMGKRDRDAAERFLREHAHRMPRTMLRYAIERFPPRLRRRYLGARAQEAS
jgi:3-methyladenine DNA glycosylase AlkD